MMLDNISSNNKVIRIVIIDSGIDTSINTLKNCVIVNTGFKSDNGKIIQKENMKIMHYHGTVVATIIKHFCSCVEFVSINILNEKLSTDGRVLIKAFAEALLYNPDIINLSLGTTKFKYKFSLNNICRKAKKNNSIVVSAVSNDGQKCYPAYLRGVIGVKGISTNNYSEIYYNAGFFYGPIYYGFLSDQIQIPNNLHAVGNSYAAAYITAYIASLIIRGGVTGRKNIKNTLLKLAEDKKELKNNGFEI